MIASALPAHRSPSASVTSAVETIRMLAEPLTCLSIRYCLLSQCKQEPEYFSDECGYDPAACPPDSQRKYIQEVRTFGALLSFTRERLVPVRVNRSICMGTCAGGLRGASQPAPLERMRGPVAGTQAPLTPHPPLHPPTHPLATDAVPAARAAQRPVPRHV